LISAAWSSSGDRIVTGDLDGGVRVWAEATGKSIWHKLLAPVISPTGWTAHADFVGFSRDDKLVVAAGYRDDPTTRRHGIVAFYDANTGRTVREVPQNEIRWAALAPDARMLVVATSSGGWGDTHLHGIEVATGQTRWTTTPENERRAFEPVAGIRFEANSPFFMVALQTAVVIRANGLTGREQRRFTVDGRTPEQKGQRVIRVPLLPAGAAHMPAGRVFDPGVLSSPQLIHVARFSADGNTMVTASGEWICVWNVEAGTLRRRIRILNGHGCFLDLSPDGKTIATSEPPFIDAPGDDTIRLYDADTGEMVLTRESVDNRACVLSFSPDSTKLLTGFYGGHAIVWDVRRRPK
jgi:WD40 repeat protein